MLQGGGALGSYQAGAYDALLAAGQRIDWVAGISIGAINGATSAATLPSAGRSNWRSFGAKPPAPLRPRRSIAKKQRSSFSTTRGGGHRHFWRAWLFSPSHAAGAPRLSYSPERLSFYDTAPLRETLLSHVDFDLLNSGATRYSIGAVNVKTGNFRYFDTTRERIGPEHVMASGALPPGLPMVEIEGEFYWDGGVVSNTPLQYVLDYERPPRDMLVFRSISSARAASCRGRCSRSPSARRTFAIPRAPA